MLEKVAIKGNAFGVAKVHDFASVSLSMKGWCTSSFAPSWQKTWACNASCKQIQQCRICMMKIPQSERGSMLQTQLSNGTETGIEVTPQTRPSTRLQWRGFLQQELTRIESEVREQGLSCLE